MNDATVTNEQLMNNFIEIELNDENGFLIVKETLTRIGLRTKTHREGKPTLFQSIHILNKRNRTFLVHFKEMFLLDGKQTTFDEDDLMRRNTIAKMLEKWNLVRVLNREQLEPSFDVDDAITTGKIVLLPHKDKGNWNLEAKYTIGKHKRRTTEVNE